MGTATERDVAVCGEPGGAAGSFPSAFTARCNPDVLNDETIEAYLGVSAE